MSLYQTIVRHLSVPFFLWRAGETAGLRYLREFEQSQYYSTDRLRQLQLTRLQAIINHAYENCTFYRNRMKQSSVLPSDIQSLDDLAILPPLEKVDIQQYRDQMVSTRCPKSELIPNQTGGSTGQPVSFYLDRDRKCSRWAATIRHNRWAGWELGDKAAVIWGASQDMQSPNWKVRARNALFERQLFLDAAHLTEEKFHHFQNALKQYRPKIIQAYSRAAVLFATYLRSQGWSTYQPQSIVVSAELLTDPDRKLLEDVFGCPVFNRYGCREVSVLASECSAHSGLHTMSEGLLIEIVRGSSPLPPGQLGEILVTDLLNYAMPLIRYRIGDMGEWVDGACSCGRGLPRLTNLAGRVTDFLVGTDGRLVSGVFLATYLVAQRPSLGRVQIDQTFPGKVCYRVSPTNGNLHKDDIAYLRRGTEIYLGPAATCDFEIVSAFETTASGKYVFSRSSVAPDFVRA